VDCSFKSTKKLDNDILDSLNKPEIPSHCGFALANLQRGPMTHIVP
jgi:hypothetical protein